MNTRIPGLRFFVPPAHHSHTPGKMNKTESAYAEHLEFLKRSGAIREWRFEALTFRLCHNEPGRRNAISYTPDFFVVTETEIQMYEVKGFWRDDARLKIKMAAELYPFMRWFAVKKNKKVWEHEEF